MKLSSRRILILILATFAVVAVACSSEDTLDLAPIIDAGAATAEAAYSKLAATIDARTLSGRAQASPGPN